MAKQEVFIQGLRTEAIIGVHDFERHAAQPLIVHLQMVAAVDFAHARDQLSQTYDYQEISQSVDTFVKASAFELIETLAHHLGEFLEREFQLQRYRLTIEKPEALSNTSTVGVVIDKLGE